LPLLTHLLFYRPQTVFELVAQLWNDSSFNPTAPASDCHSDYQTAVDCSYEVVAGLAPATPQKIEDVFTSMRSDLLRIISRWEQSGQGEGGMDNEQEQECQDDMMSMASSSIASNEASPRAAGANIGSLSGRPSRALQSRAAFLNGRPSYLLYFWEVADAHQLLVSSLQRLSSRTGATDASSAPSALSAPRSVSSSGGTRRGQRGRFATDDDERREERLFVPLVHSIKDLADCQRDMLNARSEDRQHERELEEQRLRFEREVQDQRIRSEVTENCRKRTFERRVELQDLARKYRRLNAELGNAGDENSRRMSEFYIKEGQLIEEEIRQLECNDSNSV